MGKSTPVQAIIFPKMDWLPSLPSSWSKFLRRRNFSWTSSHSFCLGSEAADRECLDGGGRTLSNGQVFLGPCLCAGLSTLSLLILLFAVPITLPRLNDALQAERMAKIRLKFDSMAREMQKLKEQLRMRRQSEAEEEEANVMMVDEQKAIQVPAGFLPFPFQKFRRIKGGGDGEKLGNDGSDGHAGFDEAEEEEDYLSDDYLMPEEEKRRAFADELLFQLFKAIPREGIKMRGNEGRRNGSGEFEGRKEHSKSSMSKVLSKLLDADNKAQNSAKLAQFQNKLMSQMRKRAEMMAECRGPPGEPGFDGADGQDGVAGPDGNAGEDFPFMGPLFMSAKGQKTPEAESMMEHCRQICPPGLPGPMGPPGEEGEIGRPGIPGENGSAGARCIGETGDQGEAGPKGLTGAKGVPGMDGGQKGNQGSPGQKGPSGPQGLPGFPGIPSLPFRGQMGPDGPDGEPGVAGPKGIGEAGLQGMDGGVCPCESSTINGPDLFKPVIIHRLSNETNALAVKMLKYEKMKQQKEELEREEDSWILNRP